ASRRVLRSGRRGPARRAEARLGGERRPARRARDDWGVGGGPAAVGAKMGAPEERRAAGATGGGGPPDRGRVGKERVDLAEPPLELDQLVTAVDEQVLAELVAAVHLEHQAAE